VELKFRRGTTYGWATMEVTSCHAMVLIAKEMRAHFEKVRLKYDEEDITPVYQERGTFVFDFWIKPHEKGKVPTASVDTAHKTLAPLAEHQEGVFRWPPRMA
jgi:hypothetical protein